MINKALKKLTILNTVKAAARDAELYKAILEIPSEYRCIQSPQNHILLGCKKNDLHYRSEFSKIEKKPSGFQFYLGATNLNVFRAYVNSSFPTTVEELFVGHSTDGYAQREGSVGLEHLDYSTVSEILSNGFYPDLRSFSFGVTELFCNAEVFVGAIGDITELLEKMPNLERLELAGNFKLSRTINLPKLKTLDINIVDWFELPISEEITKETFTHLFRSNFPALGEFSIDLNCEGNFERKTYYSFPTEFLGSQSMPQLTALGLYGLFKKGEIRRLKESVIWRKSKRKEIIINEAYYLAIDVHYEEDIAYICGLSFTEPAQTEPDQVYYSQLKVPGQYESGEFYKRELPCILKLIEEHQLNPSVIIIDGYAYLDGKNRRGLGIHISNNIRQTRRKVSVVGVAKNPRADTPADWQVYRGTSLKPLYVNAVGIRDDYARGVIAQMSGDHRQPTLLKLVDRLCRERAFNMKKRS